MGDAADSLQASRPDRADPQGFRTDRWHSRGDRLPAATGDAAAYAAAEPFHAIPPARQMQAFADGWRTPWVLSEARPLARPVPYAHPNGAVIWVNLDEAVAAQVRAVVQTTVTDEQLIAPQEAPMPNSSPQAGDSVLVPLTAGNVKHNHIYLRRAADILPDDVIGGSNRNSVAPHRLVVVFNPGATVETDIAGDRMILRSRSAVGEFFARSGAKAGDFVCIERNGPRSLRIALRGKKV